MTKPDKRKLLFCGWYLESDFNTKITIIDQNYLQNLTLYARWTNQQLYTRNGNTIIFGSFPQTKVTITSVTIALTSNAGTLPTSLNSYSWTDYGYYIDGNVESYMWYIDLEYNANKYRGVYFTNYRPRWTDE
ncbi:MAG: hypothetical protein IJW82_06115, partial [Clostridia bacterium]|nr:hypothetical protein [Clostridia bacterium]